MQIVQYTPDLLTSLTKSYNRLIADVPHCYPVKDEEFAQAMQSVVTGKYDRSKGELYAEKVFVAITGDTVKGFVHVGISLKAENEEEDVGFIRFLGYERGERQTGQTLLEKAEAYLKTYNVTRISAFRSSRRYRFYHFEHANLSGALGQVHALLGINGYGRCGGEVFLDWENYAVTPTPLILPVTLSVDWEQGRGQRPNCNVRAYQEDKIVGECDSVSGGQFSSHADAQNWLHTVWLGIENEFQGQGLGRYLLQYTLQEMHKVGYLHAAISAGLDNHRAILFYSNFGYRVVDWTYKYEKILSETPMHK